jgi:pyruvate ferredoxin oxidoreductase gamma subunit
MPVDVAERLVEMRWHGRGGQGVVTVSRLLAEAALEEGLYFLSFPDYGAERSGAPILSFLRIGPNPINDRSHIEEPDVVVVLDPTLIGRVNFLVGLKKDGFLVINSDESPERIAAQLDIKTQRVCTVNATGLAMELLGRNIPNVPILGAVLKAIPIVPLDKAAKTIESRLRGRFSERVVTANLEAFKRGAHEAKIGGAK